MCTIFLPVQINIYFTGKRNGHIQDDFLPALDMGQRSMESLKLNTNWVKSTLLSSTLPNVINEETGCLEHYYQESKFNKCSQEYNCINLHFVEFLTQNC